MDDVVLNMDILRNYGLQYYVNGAADDWYEDYVVLAVVEFVASGAGGDDVQLILIEV